MPSGLIYIQQYGKAVYIKAFGYSDYATSTLFTPFTQIHIGSLKKQFIAAAVLKMLAEKKLFLHDPISRHIKFNTVLPAKDPDWIQKTTIHHLLVHISGVLDTSVFSPLDQDQHIPNIYTDRVYINARSPNTTPTYTYSTVAYRLLEKVIENITGTTLSEYFRQNFFKPLGMSHTILHGPETLSNLRKSTAQSLSYPYYFEADKKEICETYLPNEIRQYSPTEMVSTAEDLCKWNKGLHSGKIFQNAPMPAEDLLKIMRGLYTLDEIEESHYGYGIKTYIRKGNPIYWHEGLVIGSSVYLEYSPHTDTHIVIFSNNSGFCFTIKTAEYILKNMESN